MKKKENGEKRKLSYFQRLRILAITAFSCTLILFLIICIESLMPADSSYTQTAAVESGIKDTFNVEEYDGKVPVAIDVNNGKSYFYKDDEIKIKYTVYPKSAAKTKIIYESSDNEAASVDEDGNVKFLAGDNTDVVIKVSCADYPKVFDKVRFKILGINPSTAENVVFNIPDTVENGSKIPLSFLSDVNELNPYAFTVTASNQNVLIDYQMSCFYAVHTGEVTLRAVAGENEINKTITVTAGDFTIPTSFVPGSDTFTMTIDEMTLYSVTSLPEASSSYFIATSDNNDVAYVLQDYIAAVGVGTAHITFTSVYDNTVSTTVTVTVNPVLPNSLTIAGSNKVVKNSAYSYSAYLSPKPTNKAVIWSVVSGNAEISQNGKLTASKLGKVTIRATSAADPSVYAEKTVDVKLFANFYTFVRKIIGHFSLFAILGFGFFFTFLLLLKPRWLAPAVTLFSGFAAAGISEILQLPVFTSGRYSTWTDVGIDTLGVFTGALIAAIIISLTCLIWKKANPESFSTMKKDYSALDFKSAFKKQNHN